MSIKLILVIISRQTKPLRLLTSSNMYVKSLEATLILIQRCGVYCRYLLCVSDHCTH